MDETTIGDPRLSSLWRYAQAFGTTVLELEIVCNFCKERLTAGDKAYFDFCDLSLIVKPEGVYATCETCLKAVSAVDFCNHLLYSVPAPQLGSYFFDCQIRCQTCCRILTPHEKAELWNSRSLVHKVGEKWRALCRLCKNRNNARDTAQS